MLKIRKRKLMMLQKIPNQLISDNVGHEKQLITLLNEIITPINRALPKNTLRRTILGRQLGYMDNDFMMNQRTIQSVYLVYTFKRK